MVTPNISQNQKPRTTRTLKICLLVSTIFLIIVATIILSLVFTIFKPKNPIVNVYPIGLKNLKFFQPNLTSVPLNMVVTIKNPNYGTFKTKNSTGYINFQDTIVAKVPIGPNIFPGHKTTNVSTIADLMIGILISDQKFLSDVGEDGSFNLTAKATLQGKVHLINVLKVKATVNIFCDVFFNISSLDTDSYCITKIKL
ncbi:uncharacterized protein LOC123920287 [Trifolium pratense]|uniref:Uncharacterized protein n=1 Tax=Trifolium pratense TaxID=57577 RepID=A0ACB0KHD2_TRIPR|nr:uncharacterized protein LOC123920287 [Trifolium pratense]CAJ2654887.1 unnamed protein product [Trifolium pratense]